MTSKLIVQTIEASEDEETGIVRRETFDESRGEPVTVAPKSVLVDALAQLQRAKDEQSGLSSKLSSVLGGGAESIPGLAQAEGGLENALESTGERRKAEQDIVRRLVEKDSARFSPEIRAENDEYAENIASYLGERFTAAGPGTMSDEAIGRIGEVKSLGKAAKQPCNPICGDSSAFLKQRKMQTVFTLIHVQDNQLQSRNFRLL